MVHAKQLNNHIQTHKKRSYPIVLSLSSLAIAGSIIGITIHRNINFNSNNLLKSFFLNAMGKIDKDFMEKHGSKLIDVLDRTLDLYMDEYRGEMKQELDSLLQKMDTKKLVKFWDLIRPFFMFVWDHKENKRGNYEQNSLLVDELLKFAEKTEFAAFQSNKSWYRKKINGFLRYYNEEQQEELHGIVKKINDYYENKELKDLYRNAKPLFIIWSSALCYYIDQVDWAY